MSHFRLKRRVRRAVDSLSSMSASSVILLRAMLPHPAVSGLLSGCRSRTQWPRLLLPRRHGFFKTGVRYKHRRYLTVMLALLAFSLEVCGCDLARDAGAASESGSSLQAVHAAGVPELRLAFYGAVAGARDLIPAPAVAGEALPPVRTAKAQAKPLPWAIPESVFFVYKSGEGGAAHLGRQPVATAFVLSVPDREHRRAFRFLVTARHVVDPRWANCAKSNPASIDLRLNRRRGGVAYENIKLQSRRRPRFFTPSDPAADIAIIPLDKSLIPNLNEYKFLDVPFRLLPTGPEALQFRADQQVMTARVPSWPSNDSGSYPVFDAGVLSKMPTETVAVQCSSSARQQPSAKPLHLWFIDAGFAQGASGSPVYTAITRGADGVKAPVLLGIQSVAWPGRGSAGITPSFILGELIESYLRGDGARADLYKGPSPWAKERIPSLY